MNRQLVLDKVLLSPRRWQAKGKGMTAVGLRLMALLLILVGAYSATPKTAAAQVTTVPLGCKASETGGNIVIPVNNDAPEGATVVVAVQVIARNEDLKAIVDPAGNSYTRLVKHLGFEVGPDGLKENYTLHVYIAPDAKTVKKGQTITVQWEFANQLEACAAAINGVTRTPFDQRAENHAETNAVSAPLDSLNAPNTTTPNQVLVGAFGWFCVDLDKRVVCDATSTPGAGYTEVIEGQDVMIQARSVTAAGVYKATATLDKTSAWSTANATYDWNAALITLKVDNTPPVIAPATIAGTLEQNGWYTSDVVVTWTISDPDSRVTSPSCNTTVKTDTAGGSVPCTATSAGGSSTSQSATFKRDATPPTITAAVAPAPNASGWNNSDVTVSYTCTDALAGLAAACPAPQVVSAEGNAAMPIISDLAGNKSVAGVSARIDKSAPIVAVTGVNNGATYIVGAVPAATCSTTDALSGVATQATAAVTGGGPDGLGVFTATCSGATDRVGNSSQPVAITYTVTAPPTPTPTPTPTPLPPAYPVTVWGYSSPTGSSMPTGVQGTAAVGGFEHSLVLKNDGTVVAWGNNYRGQSSVPAGLSGIKAIGAGYYHSLAIKADGTVVAWGCVGLNYSQCAPPPNLTGAISVAGGYYHSLALKSDGTVVAWGCGINYEQCKIPTGLKDVVAIGAGEIHSLALKRDGTVVAWGDNSAGQRNVPAGLSGVVAIAAGGNHNLALKSDGTVVAWGCGGKKNYGQCVVPTGLNGVVAISAGGYHSLVLKSDGTVVAWGCVTADAGQCKIPTGLSGVIAIRAGGGHNLVLTSGVSASGAAGGAVAAADTSAAVTEPFPLPALETLPAITSSVPVSGPVAVEVAPVVTDSVPVSVPAVVDTPPVTTTQPVTTGDAGAAPVDANAPAAPDASQQNQRIFLPIITNLASLAGAALGSPGGLAVLLVVVLLVVGGIVRRRRAGR